ncbi:MAG: trypsin-like peptidase domain-containing protein [Saprospiraceae bacterium]
MSFHNFIKLILAGVSGGLVVIAGQFALQSKISTLNPDTKPIATQVSYQGMPIADNTTPSNFVESAKKSTSSVVHIFAEESQEAAMEKRRRNRSLDPFADFFNLEDFFGNAFSQPQNGSGSGVIYSHDGYIITNNHVVGFADDITVTDSNGKKYKAKKVGTDQSSDLAVIKIETSSLSPIKMGDSDKVDVGEWVLAVGNPFGYLTSTVTAGIVSAKGRKLDIIKDKKAIEEFIQTDAAINPGNSGGALVNLNGELIGINTAIAAPTGVFAGYSFAIPSNIVKQVVSDIIKNGGDIERTNLGVGGYDVNPDLVKEFDLKIKHPSGFYVEEVEMRSAAQLGGVISGDVIIGINEVVIHNYEDVEQALKYKKVGDKIDIKINRKGKEIVLPVKLMKAI